MKMKRRYGEPTTNRYDSEKKFNRRDAVERYGSSHLQLHWQVNGG
jgi:hypothetical protein